MTNRIQRGDLQVSEVLDKLITDKVCVNIDVEPDHFWESFNNIVKEFTPRNKALLAEREELQTKIDTWHKENKEFNKEQYKEFLKEIGYWVETNEDFNIETTNVDAEISTIAGAQSVVPVMNA